MRELRTYASIQLIGEYGVYANGKMVQLMLPLCSTMRVIPSDAANGEVPGLSDLKVEVKATHADAVYSNAQKARVHGRLANRVKMIAQWLRKQNFSLRSGSVDFVTDFPLGLGIEDNLSFSTHWCLGPECSYQEVVERVVECEWENRHTCSYMYLLPAIKIAAEDGAARANVFLLEREMPDFKTWDEFEEMNSPDKIRPAWQWIEKAVPRRLNGIRSSPDSSESVVFDIALFARPKAALPNTLHPSVKDAVRSLDLSRSKQLLRNLGNLTDRAFHLLKKELPDLLGKAEFAKGDKESLMKLWWELGRLLTCYHFTMSAMQRTDPLSDKFVIEVTQRTNVVGAKTTGPGLGGTVLVLYFAERGKEQEVLDEVQATADRYGYTNLSGSILKAFCAS